VRPCGSGLKARYWKQLQCASKRRRQQAGQARLLASVRPRRRRILPEAYRYKPSGLPPTGPASWSNDLLDHKPLDCRLGRPPGGGRRPAGLCSVAPWTMPSDRPGAPIWDCRCCWLARSALGTLNHTLLSGRPAQRGDPAAGLVFNGPIHATNPSTLAAPERGSPRARLSAALPRSQPDPGCGLARTPPGTSLTCNVSPMTRHNLALVTRLSSSSAVGSWAVQRHRNGSGSVGSTAPGMRGPPKLDPRCR